MAKTLREYQQKLFLGINQYDEKVYLVAPRFECDWYWGFGYLQTKNSHYHVDGLTTIYKYNNEGKQVIEKRMHLFDGFKEHFKTFIIKDDKDLWTLCELFNSFYQLKQVAELFYRGGTNITTNPCRDIIKDLNKSTEINNIVLPKVFDEIYKIFEKYSK